MVAHQTPTVRPRRNQEQQVQLVGNLSELMALGRMLSSPVAMAPRPPRRRQRSFSPRHPVGVEMWVDLVAYVHASHGHPGGRTDPKYLGTVLGQFRHGHCAAEPARRTSRVNATTRWPRPHSNEIQDTLFKSYGD
jgi:hypothetical protein